MIGGSILTESIGLSFHQTSFQSRGLCLSNSEPIRTVHNSFARQQLFELDMKGGKEEDNYHFVCYLPINGKVRASLLSFEKRVWEFNCRKLP